MTQQEATGDTEKMSGVPAPTVYHRWLGWHAPALRRALTVLIAGLIVGLIESYTTQLLGPGLIDIVVFALLLLMLAVRPTGLIAERREENV